MLPSPIQLTESTDTIAKVTQKSDTSF